MSYVSKENLKKYHEGVKALIGSGELKFGKISLTSQQINQRFIIEEEFQKIANEIKDKSALIITVSDSTYLDRYIGLVSKGDDTENSFSYQGISNNGNALAIESNGTFALTSPIELVQASYINDNQQIQGVKEFKKLPISNLTPQEDNQFVNKKYVDEHSMNIPVFEFTQEEWKNISKISLEKQKELYNLMENNKVIIYKIENINGVPQYAIAGVECIAKVNEIATYDSIFLENGNYRYITIMFLGGDNFIVSNPNYKIITNSLEQTITGVKTFEALPKSSFEPTSDDELVNKKYVDERFIQANDEQNAIELSTQNTDKFYYTTEE